MNEKKPIKILKRIILIIVSVVLVLTVTFFSDIESMTKYINNLRG